GVFVAAEHLRERFWVVSRGQGAAVEREDQAVDMISADSAEEPPLADLSVPQRHFAGSICEGGPPPARRHSCRCRVGEWKRIGLSFGKTQRVPHAEGLIGVNSKKITAIRRKAERRSVTSPIGAN